MKVRVKYRVFVNKYCQNCSEIHPHPTTRYITYNSEGEVKQILQASHKHAAKLLETEGTNCRPYFQYYVENAK